MTNIENEIKSKELELQSLRNQIRYNKSTIELDMSIWNEFDMVDDKVNEKYQILISKYIDKYKEAKKILIELELIFDKILHSDKYGGQVGDCIDPDGELYRLTNEWGNKNHIQTCAYLINKIESGDI